jgi:predicted small integral membrane protein
MAIRLAKVVLTAALALQMSIIVFNNVTDYDANYQFVKHVLAMDTTFRSGSTMWRAISSPPIWHVFYAGIIVWEAATAILLWAGAIVCFRARNRHSDEFTKSKGVAIAGLTLGLLLWMVAFGTAGGEWFLMWQSQTWNGLSAALRLFTMTGVILLFVSQAENSHRTRTRRRSRSSTDKAGTVTEIVENEDELDED